MTDDKRQLAAADILIRRLMAERDQARAVLRKLAGGSLTTDGCPICGCLLMLPEDTYNAEHADDCELAAALGEG